MRTNKILIAFSFLLVFDACGTENSENTNGNLSPITRWAHAVEARLHTPQWKEPSDSFQNIEHHWQDVVDQDLNLLWRFAKRPELIHDSTVIQLTGEYVKSDSLPSVFASHMARLDTAANVQDNYMIDQRRLYSTEPDVWKNTPITTHTIDSQTVEMAALRTALLLRRQVQEMERIADSGGGFFGSNP